MRPAGCPLPRSSLDAASVKLPVNFTRERSQGVVCFVDDFFKYIFITLLFCINKLLLGIFSRLNPASRLSPQVLMILTAKTVLKAPVIDLFM